MVTDGPLGAPGQDASGAERPSRKTQPEPTADDRPGLRRSVQHGMAAGKARYSGSSAEYLVRRLNGADLMNQALILAGTLLLCAFPFLLVASSLAGRSVVSALTWRLGLSKQAGADVGQLIASSPAISGAVTGTAWVFFIVAGLAVASAVQGLYQRVFDLHRRGARDLLRAVIWLALTLGWAFISGSVGPSLRASQPVLFWILHFVWFIGYWWCAMWLLMGGKITWRRLFPCAVATALCWVGMDAVFSVVFSGIVVSDTHRYGPIGTVFALMSYFIAIGVVIILGAVIGLVWQERNLSVQAAVGKLRRAR